MQLSPYIRLLRPFHWLKNVLVFAGLFFSFSFTLTAFYQAGLAFIAFSLLASTVYIINDLADAERDRHHPTKKDRPIASGQVSVTAARALAIVLLVCSVALFTVLPPLVALVAGVYFVMNLGYSAGLKHVPILDVMIVSFGFLLRVIAGAVAIHVHVSDWIILCTFFFALFLAFGKRKNEMELLSDGRQSHRRSMQEYTDQFIDQMLGLSATTAVVFYSLYTIDVRTVARFNGDGLIYTTPIVVFGILRYYFLLYNRGLGGDPLKVIAKDRTMMVIFFVWLLAVLSIYTLHPHL